MLSPSQLALLALFERLGGSISLVSVLIIFAAYGFVPRLRNPRNTFIMFASIANVGASIGCIIARDGLRAGQDSPLCRAQSFMVHMFMQSDAWWSFGMSVNTYLVVSGRTDPNTFNKWLYCIICFGGPFISGFTLFFISHPVRGPVYGATTVWCWIREDWAGIRVFTSYVFVWTWIVGSLILNTIVGYRLFHTRNKIRNFTDPQRQQSALDSTLDNKSPLTSTRSAVDGPQKSPTVTKIPSRVTTTKRVMSRFRLQDPVKRAYLRLTFMFTLSVLVTWVPASINRIRGMRHMGVPFTYQVVMAVVMPLQGLWNALIFFILSYTVIREVAREKWGLWVLKSTAIDGETAERGAVRQISVEDDAPRSDSGSDVELHHVTISPKKGSY